MNTGLAQTLSQANSAMTEIVFLLERAEAYEVKATTHSKGSKAVAGVLGFLALYLMALLWQAVSGHYAPAETPLLVGLPIVVGMFVLPVLVGFIWLKWAGASSKREAAALAESYRDKAQRIAREHADVLAEIPAEYLTIDALSHMYRDVQTGRADSLAEAMDRYDEYLHRMRMEAAYEQLIAEQQRQAALLSRINTNVWMNANIAVTGLWMDQRS